MRFKEFLIEKHGLTAKVGLTFSASIPADSKLWDSTDESFGRTLEKAADSLGEALGQEVLSSTKVKPRNKSKWMIMTSGETDSFTYPIQIVSPIQPSAGALKDLLVVAKWIDNNGLRTIDSDTAIVALAISNINDKLDPVKLSLFVNKDNWSQIFSSVKYSPAQLEVLLGKLKQSGKLPAHATALVKAAERYLGKRADGQTNFQNLDDGMVEFKLASGAGYEHDTEQMRAKIARYVRAVEIACDPVLELGEYRKRLNTALAQQVQAPITKKDVKLPKELDRLYRFDPEILSAWKQYSMDVEHGVARLPLLVLANTALKAVRGQHESINSVEKQFLRRLMRQAAVQGPDVDEYYGHDNISRLKFKTVFGV